VRGDRAWVTHPVFIAPDLATDGRPHNRPLEEIIEHAMYPGRCFDHQRPVLRQVQVAHGVDQVGVGRGHQDVGGRNSAIQVTQLYVDISASFDDARFFDGTRHNGGMGDVQLVFVHNLLGGRR